MNRLILAAAAAAMLGGVAPVAAQSTSMSASGMGVLCSDLTAMDAASQSAFLQGYWAGRNEAMAGAAGGMAATDSTMGTDANAMAGSSTDTATAGTDAMGADADASTDATATGSTSSTDSAMSAGTSASAGGAFDSDQILTACAGSPESSISSVMTTP